MRKYVQCLRADVFYEVEGYVARLGAVRNAYGTFGRKTEEDKDANERLILKWILHKRAVKLWTGVITAHKSG
jgi:hypothetical protein